jgi:hypothetical protein
MRYNREITQNQNVLTDIRRSSLSLLMIVSQILGYITASIGNTDLKIDLTGYWFFVKM